MAKPPSPKRKLKAASRKMDESLRQRLRLHVRKLRNAEGLTLKVASERGEMHWRHWQKIEAADVNITLATLVKVARVLGVDLPELFGEPNSSEGEPTPL